MIYQNTDHSFAVCAYKESPYLENCIQSLLNQTVSSNIFISTSTPNQYIQSLAQKHHLHMIVNDGIRGIGGDWNYAYDHSDTALVTIAHQDDIYDPDYTKEMLASINRAKDPILYFCDYNELRNQEIIHSNSLLKIKRKILAPLKLSCFWNSPFIRRRILSFGNPICCPSVTLVKSRLGTSPFTSDYLSNIDWQLWEKMSVQSGAFVYNPTPLMCHRIHQESTTSELIENDKRTEEDYAMFCRFWPASIAKLLTHYYSKGQNSNKT